MIIHSYGIALFTLLPVNRLGTVDAMWPKPSESLVGEFSRESAVPSRVSLAPANPDHKPSAQSLPSIDRIWVQVRQAISLEEIARQLRIEPALLATLNLVESNHRFRQGEWLVVPAEERRAASQVAALDLRDVRRTPPAPQAPPMPTKGVVRLGDTLLKIAQRYGLTMQEILRLNPGLDTAGLVAGTEIQLVEAATPRPGAVLGLRPSTSGGLSWPDAGNSCNPRVSVSQNAVTLLYSGYTTLRRHSGQSRNECYDSQVRLFCFNGSCGVFFNSGKYGYHPLRCNAVRISQKIWRWCGNQPDSVAFEMWPHLREGVEVATDLKLWPDGFTNTREYPLQVIRAKVLAYNASLGMASTP
jgi:LysM repeat protein